MSYFFQVGGFDFPSYVRDAFPAPGFNYDEFTSYADQTAVDAVYIPLSTNIDGNTTDDRLDYIAVTDTTNDSNSRALSSAVSDTAWVLRFRYSLTAQSLNGTGYAMFPSIGLSSANHNTAEETAQDGLCINPWQDNLVRPYHISYADATNLSGDIGAGNTRVTQFTETATVGDDYYVELKRTTATNFNGQLFSGVWITSVESRALTVPSTVQTLAYFVVKNAVNTQNQAGSQTGWIDNIGLKNAVSAW